MLWLGKGMLIATTDFPTGTKSNEISALLTPPPQLFPFFLSFSLSFCYKISTLFSLIPDHLEECFWFQPSETSQTVGRLQIWSTYRFVADICTKVIKLRRGLFKLLAPMLVLKLYNIFCALFQNFNQWCDVVIIIPAASYNLAGGSLLLSLSKQNESNSKKENKSHLFSRDEHISRLPRIRTGIFFCATVSDKKNLVHLFPMYPYTRPVMMRK